MSLTNVRWYCVAFTLIGKGVCASNTAAKIPTYWHKAGFANIQDCEDMCTTKEKCVGYAYALDGHAQIATKCMVYYQVNGALVSDSGWTRVQTGGGPITHTITSPGFECHARKGANGMTFCYRAFTYARVYCHVAPDRAAETRCNNPSVQLKLALINPRFSCAT